MVICVVPGTAVRSAVKVAAAEPVEAAGENAALTPAGRPEASICTGEFRSPRGMMTMPVLTVFPCEMEIVCASVEREKSAGPALVEGKP